MSLFGKLFSSNSSASESVETQASEAQAMNDEELIAVITAAIAAFESENAQASNLVVRRVSREQGKVTVWSNAGREACMRSRRV